jgi:UPF0755 protein
MAPNSLARANAPTTRQDAAWHDGGDQVLGSKFPSPGGNGQLLPSPDEPPAQRRTESPSIDARAANGAAAAATASTPPVVKAEPRRILPRSPRTALEPEQVMMPMRQFKRAHNPFIMAANALFTLVLLIVVVGGVLFAIGKHRFDATGPLAQEKTVVIPRNSGVADIAYLLEGEGVIDQPIWFIGGAYILKATRGDLKFGEYQFPAHVSLHDAVDIIMQGKVVQHTFTIPEGLTSEQIVARLSDNDVLTGDIRDIPREGTLLPETYKFTRGMTREQMIQRMQQQQRRVAQEIWERRMPDLPIRTVEQLVTLASIIEKETGKSEERTRVAAVFVNRLKQKMKLQSDPTIIYGLVGGKGTLGRPIMRSEIEQATLYNTYVIEGLPPGPIANPGRASLEAAANPARTKELYFVADGTGGHTFSETFDQHQKAVARLRAIEAQGNARPANVPPARPPAAPATR